MRNRLIIPLTALTLSATPLDAQDVTCIETGDKSPTTARVAGIVPGAGHIYACEVLRGFGYFVVTLSIVGAGAAASAVDCLDFSTEGCGRSGDVALVAAAAVWAWTIYDAGRAAHRTNAKRRSRLSLMLKPSSWPSVLPRPGVLTPDGGPSHVRYTRPRLLVGMRVTP
jgi:hypothetical protein